MIAGDQSVPRFLIAAGGTGGHLFPAIYIADAIRRHQPDAVIEFVGTGRPLEAELLGPRGYRQHTIRTAGLRRRGGRGILEFLLTSPRAAYDVWKLLSSFCPQVVIGVGGYVTFFPIVLASLRRFPTWIHEAEAKPGLANTVLAIFARKISLSHSGTRLPSIARTVHTGHPVRPELSELMNQPLPGEPRRLLVLGGSQGARAIDFALLAIVDLLAERHLELWHQCRPEHLGELSAEYSKRGISARVAPFIEEMKEAYAWADILVSRAGAGTSLEIGLIGKPALFVPLIGSHEQLPNALRLADEGKALIVEEGEGFHSRFRDALVSLLEPRRYREMRLRDSPSSKRNAADEIARGCLDLMQR